MDRTYYVFKLRQKWYTVNNQLSKFGFHELLNKRNKLHKMRDGDFGCVELDKLTLPSSNSTTSKGKEIFFYVVAAFFKTGVDS